MVRTTTNPVNGMFAEASRRLPGASSRPTGPNPLERMIQIARRNDELLARLAGLGDRLRRARDYADDPLSNPSLAAILIDRANAAYAAVLGELDGNRFEVYAILRSCGHGAAT